MRYCDLTFAYTETSGGIRTYIDAKRRYLLEKTSHEHLLIIPEDRNETIQDGRSITVKLASPLIPGCAPYRCFWRPDRLLEVLAQSKPDVVELGSFFACPWAAFQYRESCHSQKRRCLIGGFFHTDLASAYFGSPLRAALCAHLHGCNGHFAKWGLGLANVAESRAKHYFGSIFQRCDLVFASTPRQCARLRDYGVKEPRLAPLGIDLDLFHPGRRSAEIRSQFGAEEGDVLMVYGGRLDVEKQVEVIVDAFARVRLPNAKLVVSGEGPLREKLTGRSREMQGFTVAPYFSDRTRFAALLASADIYVTAGPHETFALSVVEAQACGLPVVGVDAGALSERVRPENGRLGPVGDAVAMARNLEAVAAQRAEMSLQARRQVLEEGLGWDSTFRNVFRAYDRGLFRRDSFQELDRGSRTGASVRL